MIHFRKMRLQLYFLSDCGYSFPSSMDLAAALPLSAFTGTQGVAS
jgi:hypothetical protein